MKFTDAQIKKIKQLLAALKPVKVTLDGNRTLTVREAIFALAPTLERMKKRGFDTYEIVERLQEKGIKITPATLTRYLSEYRRGKQNKQTSMTDKADNKSSHQLKSSKAKEQTHPRPSLQSEILPSYSSFAIHADRPDDEL